VYANAYPYRAGDLYFKRIAYAKVPFSNNNAILAQLLKVNSKTGFDDLLRQ
jgi:hypothetical protein